MLEKLFNVSKIDFEKKNKNSQNKPIVLFLDKSDSISWSSGMNPWA